VIKLLSISLFLAHWLYSDACCSGDHCHPVPCNEVQDIGEGWRWKDKTFDRHMLKVSPDGNCHVCVAAAPVCIYLPARS
jgi:hypothetical protein